LDWALLQLMAAVSRNILNNWSYWCRSTHVSGKRKTSWHTVFLLYWFWAGHETVGKNERGVVLDLKMLTSDLQDNGHTGKDDSRSGFPGIVIGS